MLNIFKTFWNVLISQSKNNNSFLILKGTKDTLIVSFVSCTIAVFIGFWLGIFLYLFKINNKIKSYFIINFFVNFILSIPFLLLVNYIIKYFLGPYFGLYVGFKVSFLSLSLILIVAFARYCEQVFLQLNQELYSVAYTLGANQIQFIFYFILPESISHLILRVNSLFISSLAYSNVLVLLGLEGIGYIAYQYGVQKDTNIHLKGFEYNDIIWVSIIILFILIQIFTFITNFIARKLNRA
ncbi:ABC transporter permease subunit ['Camptotheca acuminata' phytoplasma]|uniref:ABC transporter permease subunit n=1 Tax='Camptotheca acuminata' phytoplasma TaxID=3239192 RepID=UPI003519F2F1